MIRPFSGESPFLSLFNEGESGMSQVIERERIENVEGGESRIVKDRFIQDSAGVECKEGDRVEVPLYLVHINSNGTVGVALSKDDAPLTVIPGSKILKVASLLLMAFFALASEASANHRVGAVRERIQDRRAERQDRRESRDWHPLQWAFNHLPVVVVGRAIFGGGCANGVCNP
jgi:hypothetical protein